MLRLIAALIGLLRELFQHHTSHAAQRKRKENRLEEEIQDFREDLADGDRRRLDAHLAADHDRVQQILRGRRRDRGGDRQ